MMKRLFITLIALCMAGTASAQAVTTPVPATPPTQRFRAPVGIQHAPRLFDNDTQKEESKIDNQTAYAEALNAYRNALQHRLRSSPRKDEGS